MNKLKRPTGRCFICHFPTKFNIHANCIKEANELQVGKAQKDRAKAARGKRYLNGSVPYFAHY